MSEKCLLTQQDVSNLAASAAAEIDHIVSRRRDKNVYLYGIPRGGIPAMYAIAARLRCAYKIVDSPESANFFIDDLLDSGETMRTFSDRYPNRVFVTLIDKKSDLDYIGKWIVFPWEKSLEGPAETIEDNIRRIMEFIGEDVSREGLQETPARVAKAMAHWYRGYDQDPKDVLKVFEDGAEGCDEMVVVEDIPFFSHCEHHMAPIFGTATIGYIPNGKIIGLSKIPRLLDVFARRMQVQERLTNQVANALREHLQPLGCGVVIRARHFCMESRGIEKIGSSTITSAMHGVFKDQPSTRAEFLALARKG
jgi:GTP cyclohydrolase I